MMKFFIDFYKNLFKKRTVKVFLLLFILGLATLLLTFGFLLPSPLSYVLFFPYPLIIGALDFLSLSPALIFGIGLGGYLLYLYLLAAVVVQIGDCVMKRVKSRSFNEKDALIFFSALLLLNLIFGLLQGPSTGGRPKARDARRASDVKQIELALGLYYEDHNEYPTNIRILLKEDYLKMTKLPRDISTDNPYNYVYGVDRDKGKIDYYHIGAVLEKENSVLFDDDQDYDSTHDTSQVDWRPDSKNPGPCLTANGFNGADDNDCGLSDRAGVYDRGVFPE